MVCNQHLGRRDILTGMACAGVAALASGPSLANAPARRIIDVHHHYLPPFYRDHAREWLLANGSGSDAILNWSAERAADALEAGGVETAIISISSPGFAFKGVATPKLARDCNEFAARAAADFGKRFRVFTALPMPDVQASLTEIAYGFDTLGAAGVGMMTNYDGRYLGDPQFAPVFEELNRRKAVVHVHPTTAPCCTGLLPGIPSPTLEFAVDTGRTITSLLWSGTFSLYPGIRFIFSHGGGIIATIYSRITDGVATYAPELAKRVPEGPVEALSRVYVDTASLTSQITFDAARQWVKPDRMVYGTDYPWSTPERIGGHFDKLQFDPALKARIQRDNALALFPKLA